MRFRFLSLHHIYAEARASAIRFPEVLLTSLICGTVLWFTLDKWTHHEIIIIRMMASLSLGIPLTFAVATMAETSDRSQRTARAVALGIAVALMALHYYSFTVQTPERFFYRYIQYNLAAHLLVAFLPYGKRNDGGGFWRFNEALFQRFVTSVAFSGIVYGGLIIAMVAAEFLLNIKWDHYTWAKLGIVVAFGFNTWFFLSGIPQPLPRTDSEQYPHGLKILTQYILIPLVTLYFVILYAYMFKIGIKGQWPKGTVGYLVSAFSLLGVFTLLLTHPLTQKAETKWVRVYARGFYLALFPLVALLCLATLRRISDYGITEKRYFLIVLALWFATIAAYFTAGRRDIRMIPVSLFLFTVLTSIGPFSAYSVSYRDQLARLTREMKEYGLLVDGKIQKARGNLTIAQRKNLSTRFDYLNEVHEGEGIRQWFPDVKFAEVDRRRRAFGGSYDSDASRKMMTELGVTYANRWERVENKSFYFNPAYRNTKVLPTMGYAVYVNIGVSDQENDTKPGPFVWGQHTMGLYLKAEPPVLKLILDGVEKTYPITDLIKRLAEKKNGEPLQTDLTLHWDHPRGKAVLYLSSVQGSHESAGPRVTYVNGDMFVSPKP